MKRYLQLFSVPSWLRAGFLFVACLAAGGIVSLCLGRDASSYPIEFTLYPVHALISGRMGIDVFAAGGGPAINPLLYVPYYLTFVKLNSYPGPALFLSGISYGLFLFFAWKICSCAFKEQRIWGRVTWTALSVSGSAALAGVGDASGALWPAVLLTGACWILFYTQSPKARRAAWFGVGGAAALHFSAVSAGIGVLLGVFALRRDKKISGPFGWVFAAFGFLALISVGVWYAWRTGTLDEFGTFFWPCGWAFGLPDWAVKWEVPLGFWEWFLLPVWRLRYALPGFQTDPRLACGIISAFILLGKRLSSRSSPHETAWCVFFLGTYVLWLVGFRTATSSIVLELAGVVLLGRCLTWLLGSRAGVLAGAVLLWMAFAPVVSQERLGLEDRNFAFFKEPVLSDNALVLLSGHVSGWAVFFPQDARFAGGVWFDPQDYDPSKEFFLHRLNPLPSGYYSHKRDNGVRQAVLSHQGAVYVLLPKENLTDSRSVWRRYGVEVAQPLSACQTLYPANLVEAKEFLLCRAHTLATEK